MASPVTTSLPSRTATGLSSGEAVPDLDPTSVRLPASSLDKT